MGSEMCIRDRDVVDDLVVRDSEILLQPLIDSKVRLVEAEQVDVCLLYTSDAADERSSVDLGGRRIIKKKHYVELGRLVEH